MRKICVVATPDFKTIINFNYGTCWRFRRLHEDSENIVDIYNKDNRIIASFNFNNIVGIYFDDSNVNNLSESIVTGL